MKKIQLFLLQFLLISITQHTNAQLPVKTEYTVEMGGTSGKGTYAPMWLTANRQGLSSANTENGYLRAGIAHTMPLNQHFGFSAGLDLATAYNFTSSFIIQQAYADLSYRWLNLSIGSKERLPELKNSKLSSGGMVESNNARPIPQIRLEVPDYVAIPGTHKWLHLKGHIAYGRFTDDKWQEHFTSIGNPYTIDVLYHSKSLFAKVGNKEHFPVEFEGGIQMSAQFGGDQYIAGQKEPVIDMPTRFVDFMRVLVPMAGDDTTPEGEQVNIYGNHVGSWNFAATAYLNRWKVKIYYEHYFDDHSQMFFQYGRWKDGHIGLEITFPKNRFIDTFVYEGLGTKDQTGPMLYDSFWGKFEEQISAKDNYYNHYLYQGWQHWGMGIGNPLLPGPIYNKNGQITFISNRVLAHHIGFCGSPCQSLSYRMLLSYSRHWGTYDNPLNEIKKQFNSLFEVTYAPQQLKGWSFTVSGAMDRGSILEIIMVECWLSANKELSNRAINRNFNCQPNQHMKQILLFILFMLGISSCDKAPINGKLDGRWQLMTIEYTNGKIEECNRIYYSIQLHLVEISAKGGNGGTHIGRFSYKGDEVTMSEFRHRGDEEKLTTLNELKPFGLNQAINHLKVEKATGKKLILKSDYARLTFRKF